MNTHVKICGLTRPEDVEAAIRYGASFLGFIVEAKSARKLSVAQAAKLSRPAKDAAKTVAVTVADAIEMHESTVSRVTSNKFMSTPRGMFELKYFFGASIPSIGGGEAHSAEAVRHKIKILIDEETAGNVKSDDKLVTLLRDQGIDIARRTVAKYREALGIPSSVERRRIFKHAG